MLIKSAFCQGLFETDLAVYKDKNFSFFGDNRPSDQELSINPINIYWHSEPEEYFQNHTWIKQNHHKFTHVLTWSEDVLANCSNAKLCLFGTSPFCNKTEYFNREWDKTKSVSFIRGDKHFPVPGHDLRWELWNNQNLINMKRSFYDRTTPAYASNPEEEIQWYNQRADIFGSHRYHICIENTSSKNYFTEKIIDCFLFRTIPIYWGCPNIGDYFNRDGIFTVDTIGQIWRILDDEQQYDVSIDNVFAIRDAIEDNFMAALRYIDLGQTVREALQPLLT